jgi:putative tricarboxylic transport membrane protein
VVTDGYFAARRYVTGNSICATFSGSMTMCLRALMSVRGSALGALVLCFATGAAAQPAWKPEKNIEIVVGLTAGSSQDRTARFLQNMWQSKGFVAVPATVVNRVGGAGNIAWAYTATHAGDAHWFQISSPTILTNHIIGSATFTYSDYTPLALLGNQYIGIAVQADSPLKSVREMVERLRANPASLSMATNSQGSYLHIVCAQIARASGMDARKLKLAIFQGGELMTAALGGHVDAIATVTSNLLPHVQNGKLRLIGISSARRLGGALAAVPTLKEQGVDLVIANWQGAVGPPKLSPAQIAYWDGVFARSVKTDEWRADQEQNLWESDYMNAAEFTRFLKSDYEQARSIFVELGLAR